MTSTSLTERMESGAVAVAQGEGKSLVDELDDPVFRGQIQRALPASIAPDRFLRLCLTETRKTPRLAKCTRASFLGAVMTAAQLGLEPDVRGLAYLIPRWSKKLGALEATLLIGYKGYIDLARRSGTDVMAHVVYEHDEFDYAYGTKPFVHHKPVLLGDRGAIVGAYAVGTDMATGATKFEVLRVDEINARRARSTNDGFSPWDTDYPMMARKSTVRALQAYLPQTVEFAQAVALDEQVRVEHAVPLEEAKPERSDEDDDGIPDAELVDESAGGAPDREEGDRGSAGGATPPAAGVAGEPGPDTGDDGGEADVASPAASVGDAGGAPPTPGSSAYDGWRGERLRGEIRKRNEQHNAGLSIGANQEMIDQLVMHDTVMGPA